MSLENKDWLEKQLKTRTATDIARELKTYSNKVLRAARSHGITLKSKSEVQKMEYATGKRKPPMEGKTLSAETKEKISEKVSNAWSNLTDEKRAERSETFRKIWNEQGEASHIALRKSAGKGIREASKTGSKLEKCIQKALQDAGYKVLYHKKGVLSNDKLEVDLLLPELGVAIEVDGPSHFLPIWGEEVLAKTMEADSEKNGALLALKVRMIRVRQHSKTVSQKVMREASRQILEAVLKTKNLIYIEV